MTPLRSRSIAAMLCGVVSVLYTAPVQAQPTQSAGEVSVQGTHLLRDGQPWIPHGYHQIAFVQPPGVSNPKKFLTIAYQNYSSEEYVKMREAGADSVRIQVAQTGMDSQNPDHLSTPHWREQVLGAIGSARQAGLIAIVSVQDEPQTGGNHHVNLPNAATQRVWQQIAPMFKHDRGVLFELFNEPGWSSKDKKDPPPLPPTPHNWQTWKQAMNATIRTIRSAGAINVVVADGLSAGQSLENAPLLADPLQPPQVAYASHPYFTKESDQSSTTWDKKFGDFSKRAPVIITEWGSLYYCDAKTTPAAAVSFLQYLQNYGIGLEVVGWDWSSANFGSAVYDFPHHPQFSSFVGRSCQGKAKDDGFGIGKTVEAWYRTGVPPKSPL